MPEYPEEMKFPTRAELCACARVLEKLGRAIETQYERLLILETLQVVNESMEVF